MNINFEWYVKGGRTFLMGTCINDSLGIVKCRGVETVIREIDNVYNNQMGGVDRSDQILTSYDIEWKCVKKWYKKQSIHLINVATFNSHVLHKKKSSYIFIWKVQWPYHDCNSTERMKVMKIIHWNLKKDISQSIYLSLE